MVLGISIGFPHRRRGGIPSRVSLRIPVRFTPFDKRRFNIDREVVVWRAQDSHDLNIHGADITIHNNVLEFPVATGPSWQTDPGF